MRTKLNAPCPQLADFFPGQALPAFERLPAFPDKSGGKKYRGRMTMSG